MSNLLCLFIILKKDTWYSKTCLGSIKSWIHRLAKTFKKEFNRNVIMKSCCVQSFRKLILDFLSDQFYYVVCWTVEMTEICFYSMLISFLCLGIKVFIATYLILRERILQNGIKTNLEKLLHSNKKLKRANMSGTNMT